MRWIKNQNGPSFEHYSLLKNDAAVLQLKFNYHTNTARIECEGEKRAFMIDNGTIHRNKILILNEYGFEFGQLYYEIEQSREGYVQIENKELSYVIETSNQPRILFYDETSPTPVYNCLLPENAAISFSLNQNMKNNPVSAALLLLLGWYLTLAVLKRNISLIG
jgi:hypothetical protein